MSLITVTLPDGSTKQVAHGAPVKAVAEAISPRLAEAAVVADVDGTLVDLTYPLTADAAVRIVTTKNPEALEVYRHSTAHLLAAAVNLCVSQRVAAVYYTLPDLMDALRRSYDADGFDTFFSRLVRLPVLAIDELDKVQIGEHHV